MTTSGSHPAPSSVALPCPAAPSWPDDLGPNVSDDYLADALTDVLRSIPVVLTVDPSLTHPLLHALTIWADSAGCGDVDPTKRLQVIAALIHCNADERRTAEYLLRHRADIAGGHRSALCLVRSARCAAEMDWRRIQLREIPCEHVDTNRLAPVTQYARAEDASVGETVLEFLHRATGTEPLTRGARQRFLDAVVIALELCERHAQNNGTHPTVIAMRPASRKPARLVTHLRVEFGDPKAARSLARLLLGSDGSPIETSLLWWAGVRPSEPTAVPADVVRRWRRDLLATTTGVRPSSAVA